MDQKSVITSILVSLLMLPIVVSAFNPGPPPATIIFDVNSIIDVVLSFFWPIVVGVIIISFVLAGLLFITAQGDQRKIAQARLAVVWGLAGVIVILLAWAIVNIVRRALHA